jgi:hypothetical protein
VQSDSLQSQKQKPADTAAKEAVDTNTRAFELYEKFDMNTLNFNESKQAQQSRNGYQVQHLSPIKPSFAK